MFRQRKSNTTSGAINSSISVGSCHDRRAVLRRKKSRRLVVMRPKRAHSLIEVSVLSVLFVVIAVLCLDVGYAIMASQLNDRACRDAARAAAEADNYLTSLHMAEAAVIPHRGDGYWVTSPTVSAAQFIYQDFSGNPPPHTSPYVTVTTNCNVRLPAPILFLGASFNSSGLMNFTKTYTFPIVKTSLYLN